MTTQINLESVMLREISQEKQILHGITYMWKLKKKKEVKLEERREG